MRKFDIVAEFTALAQDVAGIAPEHVRRLENTLREQYGGRKVRILETPPVTMERIDAELRQRKPVREIADKFQVSRATIYRHLSAKIPKRNRSETGR